MLLLVDNMKVEGELKLFHFQKYFWHYLQKIVFDINISSRLGEKPVFGSVGKVWVNRKQKQLCSPTAIQKQYLHFFKGESCDKNPKSLLLCRNFQKVKNMNALKLVSSFKWHDIFYIFVSLFITDYVCNIPQKQLKKE